MSIPPNKNIVMWTKGTTGAVAYNFQNKKAYAYHKFFRAINERNNFRFAVDHESYMGNGWFSNVVRYDNGELIPTDEQLQADVIYHYNRIVEPGFDPSPAVITNTPEFRVLCRKMSTYRYMPEFFPLTYFVTTYDEIREALESIPGDWVVIKPHRGQRGQYVVVDSKSNINLDDIPGDKLHSEGFLVQEFIDTSNGIPGITDSSHDLRIITHSDNISLCHVRTPRDESYICNTNHDAELFEVPLDKIPQFILEFYRKVHAKVTEKYPRPMYSMDIGIDRNSEPKLIELNSQTSFPHDDFTCMDTFITNLVHHLETVNE